jgi:hypothetical protein
MRPTFNLEPKYRVAMLTRDDWTKGTGTSPVVKGLIWFTDGSSMGERVGAGVYGQSGERRRSLGRYATVFQAEIYAILACAHEIRYTLSWPVLMKFNLRTDRRNTLVSAAIVRRL